MIFFIALLPLEVNPSMLDNTIGLAINFNLIYVNIII